MLENWPDAIAATACDDPYDGSVDSGVPTLVQGAGPGGHPEQAIEVPDHDVQDPESQEDTHFAVAHNELDDAGKDGLAKTEPSSSKGAMPPPPVPPPKVTPKIRGLAQLGITPEMSEEQIKEVMKARVAHLEHFGINGMYLWISFFKTLKTIFFNAQLDSHAIASHFTRQRIRGEASSTQPPQGCAMVAVKHFPLGQLLGS